MRFVATVLRVVTRFGVQQLREFVSFTEGPFLGMWSEETHDLNAVQSNSPSVLVRRRDQNSILHGHSPFVKANRRPHCGVVRMSATDRGTVSSRTKSRGAPKVRDLA